jgi:hypothetical protein
VARTTADASNAAGASAAVDITVSAAAGGV